MSDVRNDWKFCAIFFYYNGLDRIVNGKIFTGNNNKNLQNFTKLPPIALGRNDFRKKNVFFFFVKTVIIEGGANLKSILTLQFLHSIIFWNFGGVQANILI